MALFMLSFITWFMKGAMKMREQLQSLLEERALQCVSNQRSSSFPICPMIERKKESCSKRSAEIVKAKAIGQILYVDENTEDVSSVLYKVHFQYLIKQKGKLYMEEEVEQRKAEFYKGILVDDEKINLYDLHSVRNEDPPAFQAEEDNVRGKFRYDRQKAIQYAERWWNDYNPNYKKFEVDCTNYISQCLHAGKAPMRGYPNRSKGWWMQNNNWSFSWSVANSMRWFLPSSNVGLRAKEVTRAEDLKLGDVICYDFQGDGRFDHTTIVTAKDQFGMPLVNAHTTNSRMRYWAYEDSTAYTENIKYKFFTITDSD